MCRKPNWRLLEHMLHGERYEHFIILIKLTRFTVQKADEILQSHTQALLINGMPGNFNGGIVPAILIDCNINIKMPLRA